MRRTGLCFLMAWMAATVLAAGPPAPPIQFTNPPVAEESGMPFFATGPRGELYLSWTDMPGGNNKAAPHALRMSKWTGAEWSPAETIAQGANWFVNWADFPALAVLADGAMLAHWLERSGGGGKFGYGIRIARRAALPGSPWRPVQGLSLDEKEDYAGFLSFLPNPEAGKGGGGGGAAVYLSPPPRAGHDGHGSGGSHQHRKTVRFLALNGEGGVAAEREIDADACSCCQTAIARIHGGGWIAAYRDHQPGEIRDISVVRFDGKAWSEPRTLHADGWKINGCPTEGPSIATARDGEQVAIAWLTRAGGAAKVQLALSADAGRTFAEPLRIDGGNPAGRPAVIALAGGRGYLAAWLEKSSEGEGRAEVRLRRIDAGGKPAASAVTVAGVPAGRATGFPKIALAGDQLLVAWREGRVRVAVLATKLVEEGKRQQ